MGQQQLLLIVLGVIVVGIAVIGGIGMFRTMAIETKRDSIIDECVNLAALAQQHYLKPSTMGGGNRSFANWKIPPKLDTTANGVYTIDDNSDPTNFITLRAVGNEEVTSGDMVEVTIRITSNDYLVSVIH